MRRQIGHRSRCQARVEVQIRFLVMACSCWSLDLDLDLAASVVGGGFEGGQIRMDGILCRRSPWPPPFPWCLCAAWESTHKYLCQTAVKLAPDQLILMEMSISRMLWVQALPKVRQKVGQGRIGDRIIVDRRRSVSFQVRHQTLGYLHPPRLALKLTILRQDRSAAVQGNRLILQL